MPIYQNPSSSPSQIGLQSMVATLFLAVVLTSSASAQAERYFEIALHHFSPEENFVVVTSDTIVLAQVEQQLTLPEEQRFLFVAGPIDYGDGGFNSDWSWHHLPNEWVLAEMAIELCDGWPSFVEEDVWYWVTHVGSFCPWSAYVLYEIPPPGCCVIRGDINHDGTAEPDIADLIFMVTYIFQDGPEPPCDEPYSPECPEHYYAETDVNGDGACGPDIADLIYLVSYMFQEGPTPVPCP